MLHVGIQIFCIQNQVLNFEYFDMQNIQLSIVLPVKSLSFMIACQISKLRYLACKSWNIPYEKYWNFENWHAHLYIQYSLCLILTLKFKYSDCRTSKFLRLCLNQVLKFQNYRCATLNFQYFAYQMLVKKRQYHCMLALNYLAYQILNFNIQQA